MNLENQVVSLELSKRLKELVLNKDSLFIWISIVKTGFDFIKLRESFEPDSEEIGAYNYPALTVAELGEMLPKCIAIKTEDEENKIFSNFRLVIGRSLIMEENEPKEFWSINYICDTTNEYRNWLFDPLLCPAIYDRNEANARAKMLIHLIENNLLE